MNRLEKTLMAVMIAGIISFGTGKIIDKDYLTYLGIGATFLPIVYVIIASEPKRKNHVGTEEDQRRNYHKN